MKLYGSIEDLCGTWGVVTWCIGGWSCLWPLRSCLGFPQSICGRMGERLKSFLFVLGSFFLSFEELSLCLGKFSLAALWVVCLCVSQLDKKSQFWKRESLEMIFVQRKVKYGNRNVLGQNQSGGCTSSLQYALHSKQCCDITVDSAKLHHKTVLAPYQCITYCTCTYCINYSRK